MVLKSLRFNMTAAVLATLALAWGSSTPACAQTYTTHGPSDLMGNYYVPPAGAGMGAQLYVSPRPVPPMVGNTYITYQPLAPQEFLYHHARLYRTPHQDGSVTWTHVRYGGAALGTDLRHFFVGENSRLWNKSPTLINHGLSQTILTKGPN